MWIRYEANNKRYTYSLDNGQNWNLLEFDANVITQGVFDIARIPSIPYSKLSLNNGAIPWLKVSKVGALPSDVGAAAAAHAHLWGDISKAGAVPADVGAAATVHSHGWADVSKVGSSLSDLATRAIANLSDGNNVAKLDTTNTFPLVQLFTSGLKERGRDVAMGEYTSVPFVAGNFVGNGGGSWTVEAADVKVNRYCVVGKLLHWVLTIEYSTLAGTITTLNIAIPGGFTSAHKTVGLWFGSTPGASIGYYNTNGSGASAIGLAIITGHGSWAASNNGVCIYLDMIFEVL